jgi:hypothetical protein
MSAIKKPSGKAEVCQTFTRAGPVSGPVLGQLGQPKGRFWAYRGILGD